MAVERSKRKGGFFFRRKRREKKRRVKRLFEVGSGFKRASSKKKRGTEREY